MPRKLTPAEIDARLPAMRPSRAKLYRQISKSERLKMERKRLRWRERNRPPGY